MLKFKITIGFLIASFCISLNAQKTNDFDPKNQVWVIYMIDSKGMLDWDGKWFELKEDYIVFGEDRRLEYISSMRMEKKMSTDFENGIGWEITSGNKNYFMNLFCDEDCVFMDTLTKELEIQILELLDSNLNLIGFAEKYGDGREIPAEHNWKGTYIADYYLKKKFKHKIDLPQQLNQEEIYLFSELNGFSIAYLNVDGNSGLLKSGYGEFEKMKLNEALEFVAHLDVNKFGSGWRLPSIQELEIIYENMKNNDMLVWYDDFHMSSSIEILPSGDTVVLGITVDGQKFGVSKDYPHNFMVVKEFSKEKRN
jgi:hypothetical protein